MRTFLVVLATAAITWFTISVVHGVQRSIEKVWLISAVKAPGRMALQEIQADMNAGRCSLAKAKIDALVNTWHRFESEPDSNRGLGIGDIMVAIGKLDTNAIAENR